MQMIALIVLLITLLSFINLQTTVQQDSLHKVGIKRMVGANRKQLISEILVNRICYWILGSGLAFLLYEVLFNPFLTVLDFQIDRNRMFDLTSLFTLNFIIVMLSGLIGIYQLYKVSANSLLKEHKNPFSRLKSQKVLTAFQYAITILLLIVSGIVFQQYRFMLDKDTGLETSNIIVVDFFDMLSGNRNDESRQLAMSDHALVQQELNSSPLIQSYSQGDMPIGLGLDYGSWKLLGSDRDYTSVNIMDADPWYDHLLELEVVDGRFFNDTIDVAWSRNEGQGRGLVINEAARDFFGITNLEEGRLVNRMWGGEQHPFQIIGVVKDYHYQDLSFKINPLIMIYKGYEDVSFKIKYHEGKKAETIAFLEGLFQKVNPNCIFQFEFLQDRINQQYVNEEQTGKIYVGFTIVALVLSSIVLFAFAYHEIRRRTKEIGIRKVNGASSRHVFSLMSQSFLKTVLIGFVIACPVAWFMMRSWLDEFAFRIDMDVSVFILSGVIAVVLALLVISQQTLKLARRNPVDSLRYE